MTVTIPSSGTTAHRLRLFFARAAAVVGVSLAVSLVAPAAVAAPPAEAASASVAAPSAVSDEVSGVALVLSPVSQGLVRPGDPLTVSVTVQNGTPLTLAAGEVELGLGTSPLADRLALGSWLDDGTGAVLSDVARRAAESVPSDSSATVGVMVDAADPALDGLAPGVYPLEATYTSGDETHVSRSAMIVPDEEQPAASVGLVVPITAPPTASGLLTVDQLTELTAPEGDLTAQMNAIRSSVEGASTILAVDPAVPASIRVLGSAAPQTAVEWLTALEELPNSRFSLQFGDADVAAQLDAGLDSPLGPLSLRYAMDPADFVPVAPTPGPTPDPTPTENAEMSGDPVFPDLQALLSIDGGRGDVYWPAVGTAGPEVVEGLGALGSDATPALTLVASTSTAGGADGSTVAARGVSADGSGLLVYDVRVSTALRQASQLESTVLRGAALTEATAFLTFAGRDAGGAPLLVTLDRAPDRSNVSLGTTISAVGGAPGVQLAALATLAGADPREATVADVEPDATRSSAVTQLVADEERLTGFATILETPNLLTGPERASILQLLGIGWLGDQPEWSEALDAHREQTRTTLDSVSILRPSDVVQLSPEIPLPVWVRNDLPYPVSLVLYASPDDLRLDVQSETPVTAAASANTRVQVPVKAAIGSGEVTIELQLRSRTLVAIGGPAYAEVAVRAEWEAIGLVALSVLIVAFIGLGVVRTILRLRAARRADEADSADAEGAEADTDGTEADE